VKDVSLDEYGYLYASIPSNSRKKNIPAICFCSHVDTAPDCSGSNVKPILHRYSGKDIVLPDDTSQVLRAVDSPYLHEHIGEEIITASGLTLLGCR
jgi:tripeptide aminopeptidase